MLTATLAIIVGFIALVWSADRFVGGAASIAENMGMPPIIIGLTVVSIGTSAPEAIVSISAALANETALAVGNALGSNLANVGLVLGVTVLVVPLIVLRTVILRELPILLACTACGGVFLYDSYLSRLDGVIFLTALVVIMWVLVRSKSHDSHAEKEAGVEQLPHMPKKKAWLNFTFGLLALIASAKLLVWGATGIATSLGVSTLVIGLTVVAVGTSLPELAATVASALKGHADIAVGNIIGSNLFNLLGVMALAALINPSPLPPEVFSRDYLAMAGITLILASGLYFSWYSNRGEGDECIHQIGRPAGVLFLALYGMYYYWLFATT
ncbi:MAG: cation:H+ antiporter [Halieaceae bacterium]|jgi:cation:H+ antiporter